MTKQEYSNMKYHKEINKALRESKLQIKLVAKKDQFGDYSCQWESETGTLPEKLELIKKAREVREETIKAIRAKEIEGYLK